MADHPSAVTIRSGVAADLEAITDILALSGEAAQWNPREYFLYSLAVAECESRAVGFLVTRGVAEGEWEVLNLAVHPDYRRRSVASELLRRAMAGRGGNWFLEARASNRAAIEFYEKQGFERAGIRGKYYSLPEEDAVVMRKTS